MKHNSSHFLKGRLFLFVTTLCVMLASQTSSMAADRISSVDVAAKTITITRSSGKGKIVVPPATLKVDDQMTEIVINNQKATLDQLTKNMPVSYVTGTNGVASRIVVLTPSKTVVAKRKK